MSCGSRSRLDDPADCRLIEHALRADHAWQLEGVESMELTISFRASVCPLRKSIAVKKH